MSKVVVVQFVLLLCQFWLCWCFYLNVLLILILFGFMLCYFVDMVLFFGSSGLGECEIGEVQVGFWSFKFVEWCIELLYDEGFVGFMKDFNVVFCQVCIFQVKVIYLCIGKLCSLCVVGVIFFGSFYCMGISVLILLCIWFDVELWIIMEGWDGFMYQVFIFLVEVFFVIVVWLNK